MQVKNQAFIPTVAEFPDDVSMSWEVQRSLVDAGYRPGFMIVMRKGTEGKPRVMDAENVKRQYDNLAKYASQYGDADVVTMLSNMPVGDIDFLNNGAFAQEHVEAGIQFARNLPIGGRKVL